MGERKKILILLHEHDPYPHAQKHLVFHLARAWSGQGFDVTIQKGLDRSDPADIVVPHVDLTVIPDEYQAFLEPYPCVLNRRVKDISKRSFSTGLLEAGDDYAGPVIVKSDLNTGGKPEDRLAIFGTASPSGRLFKLVRREVARKIRRWTGRPRYDYRVFDSLERVPPSVFADRGRVVEKFLPEREEGLYFVRIYLFLGDRFISVRLGAAEAVIKGSNIRRAERVPVPDELLTLRRETGFDYGKFDYVMHDGRAVVFDMNRTPGNPGPAEEIADNVSVLGPGIRPWLEACASEVSDSGH